MLERVIGLFVGTLFGLGLMLICFFYSPLSLGITGPITLILMVCGLIWPDEILEISDVLTLGLFRN